jgi:hypothetical protein
MTTAPRLKKRKVATESSKTMEDHDNEARLPNPSFPPSAEAISYYGMIEQKSRKGSNPVFTMGIIRILTRHKELAHKGRGAKICCLCHQQFAFSSGSSTFVRHLNRKHHGWDRNVNLQASSSVDSQLQKAASKQKTDQDEFKKRADELLVQCISTLGFSVKSVAAPSESELRGDGHSFDDVDDVFEQNTLDSGEVFRALLDHLSRGKYKPPSRTTLRDLIRRDAAAIKEKMVNLFKKMDVSFSPNTATDCWTSLAGKGYYGIVLHFIDNSWRLHALPLAVKRIHGSKDGEVLLSMIADTFREYGIEFTGCRKTCICNKSVPTDERIKHISAGATTDNSGGDARAGMMAACTSIRCFPHGGNLLVKDVRYNNEDNNLDGLFEAIDKLKKFSVHVRASSKKAALLKQIQKYILDAAQAEEKAYNDEDGKPIEKDRVLVVEMVPRWSSTYNMIFRNASHLMEEAMRELISRDLRWEDSILESLPTADEFNTMRAALPVLDPLRHASTMMQGEKYPTLALVFPYLLNLEHQWETMVSDQRFSEVQQHLAQAFLNSLSTRLNNQFVTDAAYVSLVLDPRFKKLATVPSKDMRDRAWNKLQEAMNHEIELINLESPSNGDDAKQDEKEEEDSGDSAFALYTVNDDEEQDESDLSELDVMQEIKSYKRMPGYDSGTPKFQPNLKADPLAYWKNLQEQGSLPIMRRVARRYLSIPASSASVERLFSYTGQRVSKHKCSFRDEQLMELVVIAKCRAFTERYGSEL